MTEIRFKLKPFFWAKEQLSKFKTKWKGKRNSQTCYWIRTSETAQGQRCLFASAFFSTLTLKQCAGSILFFSFPEVVVKDRDWSSTTKSFKHVQIVFNFSSRIELRNLQIFKKKLLHLFFHQSSPAVSRKTWMLSWILQKLKKYARKTYNCGQPGGHSIWVLNGIKGALVTVGI